MFYTPEQIKSMAEKAAAYPNTIDTTVDNEEGCPETFNRIDLFKKYVQPMTDNLHEVLRALKLDSFLLVEHGREGDGTSCSVSRTFCNEYAHKRSFIHSIIEDKPIDEAVEAYIHAPLTVKRNTSVEIEPVEEAQQTLTH